MKTVKITSGYYGLCVNNIIKPKSAADAPFELSDEEAKRIVDLGIAEYVDDMPIATGTACEDTKDAHEISREDAKMEENPEYSFNMTAAELRAIAKNVGISFRIGTTKEEMVAALDAYYADTSPNLTVESPVL